MIHSIARSVAGGRRGIESRSLGDWQLGHRLGSGAATSVYAARPLDCDREHPWDFAIKVAHDDSDVARSLIRNEASIARKVRHPHLVTVLESHADADPAHLVMPCFEGRSLRQWLDESTNLPESRSLWIARQVAEALTAVHTAGWRHADVKPDNVIVGPNGHVTLLDLGLAQPLEAARLDACTNWIGTPDYMAPECFATPYLIGPATDTYSLGVMLFEMIAGQRPFAGADVSALAEAHRYHERPALRQFRPDAPIRVEWLTQRMMAREPLRRPTSRELIDALVSLEIEHLGDGY